MPHRESNGTASAAPLDLSLLRTFLAVHRAGSFTAAARLLGLSQPTVTTQIRSLEDQLGRELFERRPRGAVSTSVSDEPTAQVAAPLDALATVTDRGGFGADLVPEPGPCGGSRGAAVHAGAARTRPADRAGVRLRVTTGLTDGLSLVTYAEDLPIARRYWRHVFGVRLTGQAAITVPDLRGVLAAVVAGAGISVLLRYLCLDELASGTLVPLLAPEDPPINTAHLARHPGVADNPHVELVRERLLAAGRTW